MFSLVDCPWEPLSRWVAFWFGCAGAAAVSVLQIGQLYRKKPVDRPATFSDPLFWFYFAGPVPISGFFVMLTQHELPCLTPTMAFLLGILAPSLIKYALVTYGLLRGDNPLQRGTS